MGCASPTLTLDMGDCSTRSTADFGFLISVTIKSDNPVARKITAKSVNAHIAKPAYW